VVQKVVSLHVNVVLNRQSDCSELYEERNPGEECMFYLV
jgi:hypothetical protein